MKFHTVLVLISYSVTVKADVDDYRMLKGRMLDEYRVFKTCPGGPSLAWLREIVSQW